MLRAANHETDFKFSGSPILVLLLWLLLLLFFCTTLHCSCICIKFTWSVLSLMFCGVFSLEILATYFIKLIRSRSQVLSPKSILWWKTSIQPPRLTVAPPLNCLFCQYEMHIVPSKLSRWCCTWIVLVSTAYQLVLCDVTKGRRSLSISSQKVHQKHCYSIMVTQW